MTPLIRYMHLAWADSSTGKTFGWLEPTVVICGAYLFYTFICFSLFFTQIFSTLSLMAHKNPSAFVSFSFKRCQGLQIRNSSFRKSQFTVVGLGIIYPCYRGVKSVLFMYQLCREIELLKQVKKKKKRKGGSSYLQKGKRKMNRVTSRRRRRNRRKPSGLKKNEMSVGLLPISCTSTWTL